jgi:DNA-binding CsgD family transcriptional regulator
MVLTGGELRVVLAVAPGLGIPEAAELLGLGKETVKKHLQRAFEKTGTKRQAELARLLMAFAAHARIGAARADNPRAVESGRLVRSFRRQPSVETGGWPEVVLLFGLGPFSIPRSGDACSGVVR